MSQNRQVGLLAATGVGVGAIVGGGILVLAGVAFEHTGPSAMVAFALDGAIALLTALSFAEMATAFPESGGAYNFSKKVLSVRAAFAVGWVLWFAYIVAGVLYAMGFASYALTGLADLWRDASGAAPVWLSGRRAGLLLAAGAAAFYAGSLIRRSTGGGRWATVGKVVVFCMIIVAGLVAVGRQPLPRTRDALLPFAPGGATGLLAAMGFSFIALQGFDLIAAIAGEIREPLKTIPRAMFLSLGAALAIYLPLLFLVATVGVGPGESIRALSSAQPETVMAVAVRRFMGVPGYWLVIVAAVFSTLSALHANVLAASRVAMSMARDRTLPVVLSVVHRRRGTPAIAIYATVLALVSILVMVPDLAAAGAAASLIFLVSFALAHLTALLMRRRGGAPGSSFRTPFYPLVPATGLLACSALALYQAVMAPAAAAIVAIWMGLGGILYFSLFAARAETTDAATEAFDPELARLRGRSPLVLLPVANPARAASLVAVANALAPPRVGRVLLLTIVPVPGKSSGEEMSRMLGFAQQVIQQALTSSFAAGDAPDALVTSASEAWEEIRRVARLHRCESLLLGLGPLSQMGGDDRLGWLLDSVDCDVALMRAPQEWRLERARRVLVPVGGRGLQHGLRARLLGSLSRTAPREVTFLRVLPERATDAEAGMARRELERMARDKVPGECRLEVARHDDVVSAILTAAARHDLVVLGLPRVGRQRAVLDGAARRIAHEAPCAAILLSRGR